MFKWIKNPTNTFMATSFTLALMTLTTLGVDLTPTESSKCGVENRQSEQENRIIGGILAEPGQFPWQVHLSIWIRGLPSFCGGTIISNHHGITAAHCVENIMHREDFR